MSFSMLVSCVCLMVLNLNFSFGCMNMGNWNFPIITTPTPTLATRFLIKSLVITPAQATQVLLGGTTAKDFVLDLINKEIKKRVEDGEINIDIQEGDFIVDAAYPDRKLAGSCGWWVDAISPKAKGIIKKSSKLEGNQTSPDPTHHQAFGAAIIDAELKVDVSFRLNLGVRFFGKCRRYARKTWPVSAVTTGKTKIQVSVEARDLKITRNGNNQIDISFLITYGLTGYAKDWKLNQFDVSKCSVSILGIKLFSYCGLIKGFAQKEADKYINKFEEIDAPKIFQKLADKLEAKNDNLVKISLKY